MKRFGALVIAFLMVAALALGVSFFTAEDFAKKTAGDILTLTETVEVEKEVEKVVEIEKEKEWTDRLFLALYEDGTIIEFEPGKADELVQEGLMYIIRAKFMGDTDSYTELNILLDMGDEVTAVVTVGLRADEYEISIEDVLNPDEGDEETDSF